MASRALIIAIESYPNSAELAKQLPDVNKTAKQFFDWLVSVRKLAASDVFVCAAGATFAGAQMFPTARESIMDGVQKLVDVGRDTTEALFVYYSGHGFCFQESLEQRALEILVASDFESAAKSGTKCIKLGELQEKLNVVLGGTHHFYFIDACRTLIREDEIDPIGLGRKLGQPAERSSRPPKSILFSTAYGDPAAANSKFTPALLDGLNGHGRAKGYVQNGDLYVMFPRLVTYVQGLITDQKVEGIAGDGEGRILQLNPIPRYKCAIVVDGAKSADTFDGTLRLASARQFTQPFSFQGGTHQLAFDPNDWLLEINQGGQALARVKPPADAMLDFFDDCTATFGRGAASAPAAPPVAPGAPPTAAVTLQTPMPMTVRAINLATGARIEVPSVNPLELTPGQYELALRDNHRTIQRTVVNLTPGARTIPMTRAVDPVRASIIKAAGGDPSKGVVTLSKSLGPIADPDLTLWLTLIAASHILREPSTFETLKDISLDDFSSVKPDQSRVYFLVSSAGDVPPTFTVGKKSSAGRAVKGLLSVSQAAFDTKPGSIVVTMRAGHAAPRTFASYCLPNRVTLFVAGPDEDGRPRAHQYLLPVYSLFKYLDQGVHDRLQLDQAPLRLVRAFHQIQRQFSRGRSVEAADDEQKRLWGELVQGKWLDPIMSLVASYEIVRRGDKQMKDDLRKVVIPNLEKYFAGIPDIAAIARAVGLDRKLPSAPPLFTEGLLLNPDWENVLKLDAGKLDYTNLWTTWRAAARRARAAR